MYISAKFIAKWWKAGHIFGLEFKLKPGHSNTWSSAGFHTQHMTKLFYKNISTGMVKIKCIFYHTSNSRQCFSNVESSIMYTQQHRYGEGTPTSSRMVTYIFRSWMQTVLTSLLFVHAHIYQISLNTCNFIVNSYKLLYMISITKSRSLNIP